MSGARPQRLRTGPAHLGRNYMYNVGLDSLVNCYNCSRLPTARKIKFATSKTCENVVSIGRHHVLACSQEAESPGHTWSPHTHSRNGDEEMKDVERTFCRSKYEYSH